MKEYLTYSEVQERCSSIAQKYEIHEDKFYDIVEKWAEEDVAVNDKLIYSFTELLQLVSDEIAAMEKSVDLSATCRAGCAFCCYFPIIVNEMEVKMMKQAIESFPDDRKEFIKDHIKNYYTKYKEKINQLSAIEDDMDEDFKYEYRKLLMPCPLLNTETNQCLAYEVRPIPCRTYVNYTDPKICEDNIMPKETVSFEFLYEQYMGALNEFLQFLYEEEGDTGFIQYPDDVFRTDYLANWLKPEGNEDVKYESTK